MEQQIVWSVLGLEPTKDENTLKNRYHELLREVNPEDDPEGFKRLREAYETAMELARKPEELSEGDEKPKDEIDLWLDKVNEIYWYVDTRTNPEMWEKLFDDPICIALDTALEVRERFLVFLMSHVYIDQRIWKLIDKEFKYNLPPEVVMARSRMTLHLLWEVAKERKITLLREAWPECVDIVKYATHSIKGKIKYFIVKILVKIKCSAFNKI